ncbi:predicted protein [Enterococcus faecalis JH1]|nr:predicted protein [Enterococcus faecalis ATCC 4200]EEU73628.1 predicted protein [Enterococcus faecalis JH1]
MRLFKVKISKKRLGLHQSDEGPTSFFFAIKKAEQRTSSFAYLSLLNTFDFTRFQSTS